MGEEVTWGVLYAVVGEKYFAEAATSIGSLIEVHPEVPIEVLTFGTENTTFRSLLPRASDLNVRDCTDYVESIGIDVVDVHAVSRALKVGTMRLSQFPRTIFLDSDTYVKGDLAPLVAPLDLQQVDLVVTNEPMASHVVDEGRTRPVATKLSSLSNPEAFNSGVFAFSERIKKTGFADAWVDTWTEQVSAGFSHEWGRLSDQRAFNKVIKTEEPKLVSMSNTVWNAQCKIIWELFHKGVWDEIHVIHCKLVHKFGPDPERLCQDPYVSRFRLVDDG
ncbi:MAG: hypothetical protein ACU0FO_09210 [Pseudooceanicola nanhaiensis]|uniref:hypothetical protein n=1 Tax=Pseudooceanicola nanhaiensis TaxID=375761 RepID=UPI0040589E73